MNEQRITSGDVGGVAEVPTNAQPVVSATPRQKKEDLNTNSQSAGAGKMPRNYTRKASKAEENSLGIGGGSSRSSNSARGKKKRSSTELDAGTIVASNPFDDDDHLPQPSQHHLHINQHHIQNNNNHHLHLQHQQPHHMHVIHPQHLNQPLQHPIPSQHHSPSPIAIVSQTSPYTAQLVQPHQSGAYPQQMALQPAARGHLMYGFHAPPGSYHQVISPPPHHHHQLHQQQQPYDIGNGLYCGKCSREVYQGYEQSIICKAGCGSIFHISCSGLTQLACDLLMKEDLAEWVCDRCTSGTRTVPFIKYKT